MSAWNALKRASRLGIVPAMIVTGLVGAVAAAPKPAPSRSLVLITLDTTRADHLGSYGWKAARTPNLDALAARGTRALRVLDASIAAGSYSSEVYLERGLIQVGLNRIEDALRDFREAARRNPENPVPLENAARAAYRLRRTRESVQLYEQLLHLQPGRVDLWKTAGAIYLYELKDGADAERCFRRALTLETDPGEREKIEQALAEIGS